MEPKKQKSMKNCVTKLGNIEYSLYFHAPSCTKSAFDSNLFDFSLKSIFSIPSMSYGVFLSNVLNTSVWPQKYHTENLAVEKFILGLQIPE